MNSMDKLLAGHWELILFIAIFELIVIIALVVISLWNRNNDDSNTNGLNISNGNINGSIWRQQCQDLNKDLSEKKREIRDLKQKVNSLEKELRRKGENMVSSSCQVISNLESDKVNVSSNNEPHSEDSCNVEYNETNEKGGHVYQTENDDGTFKSEIDFGIENSKPVPDTIPLKYEYLETANNGQFRKLLSTDERSFFRTWVENGIRKFEFAGNLDNALANINAIFDDVCEIEGKQNGATQIYNVEPGILNSQLKVEKKAVIKLI